MIKKCHPTERSVRFIVRYSWCRSQGHERSKALPLLSGQGGRASRRTRRKGGGRSRGNEDNANAPLSLSLNDRNNAAMNLLDLYNEKRSGGCGRGGGGAMTLMTAVIESYMLGMCNRRVLESGGGGGASLSSSFGNSADRRLVRSGTSTTRRQTCKYARTCREVCPSMIVYEIDDGAGGG